METMILRRDLSICRVPGRGLLLTGEHDRIWVTGSTEEALVEALAAGGDSESAARMLGFSCPSEIFKKTMLELSDLGILVPANDSLPSAEAAHWEACGLSAAYAERRLRETAVTIRLHGTEGENDLARAVKSLGMTVLPEADFLVAIADDYLQPEIGELYARRRDPWMLIKPIGTQVWIGPIFVPGRTVCYGCFRIRLVENRWTDIPFWVQGIALPSPSKARLATTPAIAALLAAQEIARWAVEGDQAASLLHVLDTSRNSFRQHHVIPRGDCTNCSAAGVRPPDSATLPGALQYVSPICGLFHDMRDLTPDPQCPVRIHVVRYTLPYTMGDPAAAMYPPIAVGRGFSHASAQFSSLAEAIERRSLFFRGSEKRLRQSYSSVNLRAIHPQRLLLFSARQYADRALLNPLFPAHFQIPDRFDENQELDWTPIESLSSGEEVLAPTSLCYLRHSEPMFEGVDSNGCAAGQTRDAALLLGFYELVEREAAAIWWYNRVPRPQVSLRSLDDPEIFLIARYLERRGICFYLLDLTTDWEIPVIAAVSHHADGSHISFAFGCHAEVERAAKQASTELVQTLVARQQRPAGLVQGLPVMSSVADYPYLQPAGELWIRPPADRESGSLRAMAVRAKVLGLELFALDLTRPDTGLPVVRAIIPDVCARTPRFGARRLYEVPLRLGWVSQANNEEDLNPELLF